MSQRVQDFVYTLTQSKAADLLTSYNSLPEDKRNWSPGGKARTAGDMVAEVAILNGETAKTLTEYSFSSNFDFEGYAARKSALAADPAALLALYEANLANILEAIKNLPDDKFEHPIEFPWGTMTLGQIISYPYWNMGYHEGQINFIGDVCAA